MNVGAPTPSHAERRADSHVGKTGRRALAPDRDICAFPKNCFNTRAVKLNGSGGEALQRTWEVLRRSVHRLDYADYRVLPDPLPGRITNADGEETSKQDFAAAWHLYE